MKTLILFLSVYNNQPEAEYSTDRKFTVTGAQTNEAPVKYAVERLKENDEILGKIIALTTPKARNTALEIFRTGIESCSPITDIIPVDIPDNVTITELLKVTLEELLPLLEPPDTVIIETSGGYRNTVNALTLLGRFLHYSGVEIEFSTYSDFQNKRVTDTKETDSLAKLLEAVNVFATSGNPKPLIEEMKSIRKIPEKTAFVKAIQTFYDTLLCCKMSRMDDAVLGLRQAIISLLDAEYNVDSPKLLVFRELVSKIVRTKMAFIYDDAYLDPLIRWCCENDYIQQAVTILVEKILSYMEFNTTQNRNVRKKTAIGKSIDKDRYDRLVYYRNNINHADGIDVNATAANISKDILDTLNIIGGKSY